MLFDGMNRSSILIRRQNAGHNASARQPKSSDRRPRVFT
jgi:hypothetical protein